jgi:hypothetical protein
MKVSITQELRDAVDFCRVPVERLVRRAPQASWAVLLRLPLDLSKHTLRPRGEQTHIGPD